jgi:hypothetical protein
MYVPIITAFLGLFAGILTSYISFKSKKIELEHAYNWSINERNHKISMDNINLIYIPLYRILLEIEEIICSETFDQNNKKKLVEEVSQKCSMLKKDDSLIFLRDEIETAFLEMCKFIEKSLKSDDTKYGIRINYELYGIKSSKYIEESFLTKKEAKKNVFMQKVIHNIVNNRYGSINISSFVKMHYEVVPKTISIYKDEFDDELNIYIKFIKSEVKKAINGGIL